MTSFGTEVTTGNETYRFLMRDSGRYSLLTMRNTLTGLDRLMWAVAIGTEIEQTGSMPGRLAEETLRAADSQGRVLAGGARVQRLNYNSPLEIVLAIGAVGGGALMFGNRLIDTFNRFQYARVTKAESDAKVAAYKAVRHAITGVEDDAQLALLVPLFGQQMEQDVRAAAETLSEVDNLEALPPA